MADQFLDLSYNSEPGAQIATAVARPLILTGVTATAANPGVFTKTAHTLVDNDIVICSGFTEMTDVNGNIYLINQLDENTFNLVDSTGIVDTSGFAGAETTGGTVSKIDTDLVSPTNDIRLYYDDTVTKDRLIDGVQRAKEALVEVLA